jgi:hypothetical protein
MHLNGEQYRQEHIIHLIREIDYLKTQIQPHDTGHIYTTISTLEHRVQELMSEAPVSIKVPDNWEIELDSQGSYISDSNC